MRYFAVFLLLFAFGLTLPACAQKTTTRTQKVKTKKVSKKASGATATKAEPGPVVTFERTPCFGTCPAYVMQVFADGRVQYEGRRGVPFVGKKEFKLPAAVVADLQKQAAQAHFEQFEARYSRNTTDLPSTVIGVRQPNGQLKTVTVEEGAPDNVTELFTYFTNQLDPLARQGAEK